MVNAAPQFPGMSGNGNPMSNIPGAKEFSDMASKAVEVGQTMMKNAAGFGQTMANAASGGK